MPSHSITVNLISMTKKIKKCTNELFMLTISRYVNQNGPYLWLFYSMSDS